MVITLVCKKKDPFVSRIPFFPPQKDEFSLFPEVPFRREISVSTKRGVRQDRERRALPNDQRGRISEKKRDKRERKRERSDEGEGMKGADLPSVRRSPSRGSPFLDYTWSRRHSRIPVSVKSPCYVSYCQVNAPSSSLSTIRAIKDPRTETCSAFAS